MVTVEGIVVVVMTMAIAGLQGARRIEVVVITLQGVRLMVEGQEGSGQGHFHILLMVVAQKGTIAIVEGNTAY